MTLVWGMSSEGVWSVCTTGKAGRLPMALHSKYVPDQDYGAIEADTKSKKSTATSRRGADEGREVGPLRQRGLHLRLALTISTMKR